MNRTANTRLTAVAVLTAVLCATTSAPAFSPNMPKPSVRPHIVRPPSIRPHIQIPSLARHIGAALAKKKTKRAGQRRHSAAKPSSRPQASLARPARRPGAAAAVPLPRPRGVPALDTWKDRIGTLAAAKETGASGDIRQAMETLKALDGVGDKSASETAQDRASWLGDGVPRGAEDGDGAQAPAMPQPDGQQSGPHRGSDQPAGIARPHRPRGGSTLSGFASTPGAATAGLPGRGGETANNGSYTVKDADGEGYTNVTVFPHPDGGSTTRVNHYKSDKSIAADRSYIMYVGPVSEPVAEDEVDMVISDEEAYPGDGPSGQPNPENAGSRDSMPCPKSSRDCGAPSETVMGSKQPDWQDSVSRPGGGSGIGEGGEGDASPDVTAEAVTDPSPIEDSYRARTSGTGYSREQSMQRVIAPPRAP